ncbi:MAG: hypothetical protein ACI4GY_00860 [Acutalibacteraceae bacterium]
MRSASLMAVLPYRGIVTPRARQPFEHNEGSLIKCYERKQNGQGRKTGSFCDALLCK